LILDCRLKSHIERVFGLPGLSLFDNVYDRKGECIYLSFACPKERNKEKDTQKNAALRACLGYPRFLGRQHTFFIHLFGLAICGDLEVTKFLLQQKFLRLMLDS
jgi:hypothetical protein